jgi:hypothetical protein
MIEPVPKPCNHLNSTQGGKVYSQTSQNNNWLWIVVADTIFQTEKNKGSSPELKILQPGARVPVLQLWR